MLVRQQKMPRHDAGVQALRIIEMMWPGEMIWQQVMALGMPRLAGFSVEILPEIDSTNTELMRRAHAGRFDPILLIAERQTAGRGRLGRTWESAGGDSLTFSLGLNLSPGSWEGLSLAVGVSLADRLDPLGQLGIRLKWPNDLWWHDQKLGGILIETTAAISGQERYAVLGVGLNVRPREFEQELRTPVACLNDFASKCTLASVLESVFLPLLEDVLHFERCGFGIFAKRFAARDALMGRQVVMSDGRQGLALGVDAHGAMLVHTAHGVQRVNSQELSVRPHDSSDFPL